MKRIVKEYSAITVGTLLLAIGFNLFLVPNRISSGGVSSIGTVLLYLFSVPLSVTNLIFNAILLVFGYKCLGRVTLIRTLFGIVLLSVFLELTGALPTYRGDLFASALLGGLLMGLGIGMVVRRNASTGGSDLAGMILHRFFPHLSVAILIMIVDCLIVAGTGLVFRSLTVTVYSGVALLVCAKVTDLLLTFGDAAKSVSVFSKKSAEIADEVLQRFGRGITAIPCRGMYTNEDGDMLLCVVSPKELPKIINTVRKIDAGAFIIINDSREVLGEGFKIDEQYRKM